MSGLVGGALLAGAVLQGPPVFRAEVDLVRVEVLVTRGGVPVRGLGAADFEVRDNGRLQALEPTLEAEAPVDAVLVLDTSYRMVGARLRERTSFGRDSSTCSATSAPATC